MKEISRSCKTKHQVNSTYTKNQNQINILQKISIKITPKRINTSTENWGNRMRMLDLTLRPINLQVKSAVIEPLNEMKCEIKIKYEIMNIEVNK